MGSKDLHRLLNEQCLELFPMDNQETEAKGLSIEQKCQMLELTTDRINYLKDHKPEEFDGDIDLDNYNTSYEHIDVSKIVGYGNHDPDSWYDALSDEVCHKTINFEKYDSKSFPGYINSEMSTDLPSVIESDGKYYICGGGTHRLTIAKLTGCERAYVAVHRKERYDIKGEKDESTRI